MKSSWKLVLLITFFINSAFCQSKVVSINCKFGFEKFASKNISSCKIEENLKVYSENIAITIKNAHENKNVRGFIAKNKHIFYMPKNIGNDLKFIQFLEINNCSLRKITSENLKEFKSLKYLCLSNNKIEHLESALFQHNPELNTVNLNYNQISWIEPTVLGSRSAITVLALDGNVCYSDTAIDKASVAKMIEIVKTACNVNLYKVDRLENKCGEIFNITNGLRTSNVQNEERIKQQEVYLKDELEAAQKNLLKKIDENEKKTSELINFNEIRFKKNLEVLLNNTNARFQEFRKDIEVLSNLFNPINQKLLNLTQQSSKLSQEDLRTNERLQKLEKLPSNESKALKETQKHIAKLNDIIDELKRSQKMTKALNNETKNFDTKITTNLSLQDEIIYKIISQVSTRIEKIEIDINSQGDQKYLKMSMIVTVVVIYICNFLLIYCLFPDNDDEKKSNTNRNSKLRSVLQRNRNKKATIVHNALYEEVK